MLFNKKASAAAGVIVVIIVIILLFWIVRAVMKECNKDTDCSSGYYCGSDFKCHEMKTVEKTIIQSNFSKAAYIIGFAIIMAAIILRFKPKKLGFLKSKVKKDNFIEKNPPINYSFFSDEKEPFK